MNDGFLLLSLIIVPIVFGLLSLMFSTQRKVLATATVGVLLTSIIGALAVYLTFARGPLSGCSNWLYLDALSAFNLAVMLIVCSLTSVYSLSYFGEELLEGRLNLRQTKMYTGLSVPTLGAMILVLVSNNLGLMWAGVETTTLLTAFLISVHASREALEAMWKYMILCSVGVAFAFMGTLLAASAAQGLHLDPNEALLWTKLRDNASQLDPMLIKAAFIFLLVGYGTKTGLVPLHSWLPDAHSKASAPVSAVFSGFKLNTALYCLIRYVPIVEGATGNNGWSLKLLIGFGLLSIIVASVFILVQHDLKRLLAYSSVEHLGIITLGFGLGGFGTFAALFHTLNHSLCKTLAFFAAGRLGQCFGTHEMKRMAGSFRISPIWGLGIFASILALIGVAPFALFMSELQLIKAALDNSQFVALIIFFAGTIAVFVGALGHAMPLFWGEPSEASHQIHTSDLDVFLVILPLVAMVVLGLWMPAPLEHAMREAAAIVHNTQEVLVVQNAVRGGL